MDFNSPLRTYSHAVAAAYAPEHRFIADLCQSVLKTRLKSLQTDTQRPHPEHFTESILISAFSFVLDVGIAIT
jgi:hypothetical protein